MKLVVAYNIPVSLYTRRLAVAVMSRRVDVGLGDKGVQNCPPHATRSKFLSQAAKTRRVTVDEAGEPHIDKLPAIRPSGGERSLS